MAVIFDEWLEINSVDLATHAYWIESLAPLFTLEKRGADRLIPNLPGLRPYKRVTTAGSVSLTLNVFGDVDVDGVVTADPRQGLYDHLRTLETALLADVATTAGTLAAIWHLPDASTRSAAVHVDGWTVVGNSPHSAVCNLGLTIPAGRWVDVP